MSNDPTPENVGPAGLLLHAARQHGGSLKVVPRDATGTPIGLVLAVQGPDLAAYLELIQQWEELRQRRSASDHCGFGAAAMLLQVAREHDMRVQIVIGDGEDLPVGLVLAVAGEDAAALADLIERYDAEQPDDEGITFTPASEMQ